MARSNELKQKLRDGVSIGSWITIGHTAVAEIMAGAGFDWLVIDMEHSVITLDKAQQLIQVIELSGTPPLIRVGENSPNIIKKAMDTGAHGVIVPMVNSRAQAEAAVSAVKYPPAGTRGVGLARAQGYGADFLAYRDWVNTSSVVIVQVEHIDSVNNLARILAVPGVDGFIVGPYDLSGSLGVPGQFDHPEVKAALSEIMSVAADFNSAPGFHVIQPQEELLNDKVKEGYRFIAYSLDILFLGNACRRPKILKSSGEVGEPIA